MNCPTCRHRLVWHLPGGCCGMEWTNGACSHQRRCGCTHVESCPGAGVPPITTCGEFEGEGQDCGCAVRDERFHLAGFCVVCRMWQHTYYPYGARRAVVMPHIHSRPWSDQPVGVAS